MAGGYFDPFGYWHGGPDNDPPPQGYIEPGTPPTPPPPPLPDATHPAPYGTVHDPTKIASPPPVPVPVHQHTVGLGPGYDAILALLLGHTAGGGGPFPRSVNIVASQLSGAINAAPYLPIVFGKNLVNAQWMAGAGFGLITNGTLWFAIAEGEIDGIDELYINGASLTFLNARFPGGFTTTLYTGTQTQAENAALAAALGWHPGGLPGTAYVAIQVTRVGYSPSWISQIPGADNSATPALPPLVVQVVVRGTKIYDPRLDASVPGHTGTGQSNSDPTTWAISYNPVLHWRHLRRVSGVENAYIDDVNLIAAANACDALTWPGHTSTGVKRFVSNLVVAQQGPVQSYMDQLALACNGYEHWPFGQLQIFIDVENTASPLLTLDSARNFESISYTWLERKAKPTQVSITYRDATTSPPYQATTVLVPPTVAAGVELVQVSYNCVAITDQVHAQRAADYVLNVANVTPFRAEGDSTYVGIRTIPRGTKIAITTSDGPSAQEMLVDVALEKPDGWHLQLRQYSGSVYLDSVVSGVVPVTTTLPDVTPPPPPAAPRVTAGLMLAADPPRIYTAAGPYGSSKWTVTGAASYDASKINDGNTTVAAITTTAAVATTVVLDLGVGVTAAFGLFDMWTDTPRPPGPLSSFTASPFGPLTELEYSDDGVTYTGATFVTPFVGFSTCLWQDAAASGIYPQHIEVPSAIGAHRWWRLTFYGAAAVNVYEIRASTFTDWPDTPTGYEVRAWSGGGLLPTFFSSDPLPVMLFTTTLPTEAAPLSIGMSPISQSEGTSIGGFTAVQSGVITTRSAANQSSVQGPPFFAAEMALPEFTPPPVFGSGGGAVVIEQPAGVIDGANKVFTLSYQPSQPRIALLVDGQQIIGGRDYTRVAQIVTIAGGGNAPEQSVLAIYTTADAIVYPISGNPEAPTLGTADTWVVGSGIVTTALRVAWSPSLGMFVAVASLATYTSTDGQTWTSHVQTWSATDVIWDGAKFVALGSDYWGIYTWHSPDGLTWTVHAWAGTGLSGFTRISYSGSRYVTGKNNNLTHLNVATSADAVTWTVHSTAGTNYVATAFSPSANAYVALGADCVFSTDGGVTWTPCATPPTGGTTDVVWVSELALFVACGIYATGGVATSPDGSHWTVHGTPGVGGSGPVSICWSSDRQILCVGGAGLSTSIMKSYDATNWSLVVTNPTGAVSHYGMAAGTTVDVIVAVGNGSFYSLV